MARTVYYCAMSLDGYIAEADDTIDWLTGYAGSFEGEGAEPIEGHYRRFYDGVGALVMGSVTYSFVLDELGSGAEWPYRGKPAFVLSSRDLPLPDDDGRGVRIVAGRVSELYPEIRDAAGDRDVWVVGGGNVASQFAEEDLLDDLRVTVVPVVLGEGKTLFTRGLPGGAMRLAGWRAFDNGMVELRYTLGTAG